MPGRVPEHVVQRIARSTDIVRLIGRYTQLKQQGNRYVGLCPFHKEKTPSFSVDPEQGLYYCFGCKKGGNVFTFLKEVEGLEFYEALQQLARDAGIDLSQYGSSSGPSREMRNDLRGVVELAAKFYEKCLQKARGSEEARKYLANRQISDESIEQWRLGYAPDGWEHVLNLGRRRNIPPDVLEKAGLVKPRSNAEGHYDRFRNRLMFPVRDRNHAPIGFGARALTDEDQPKYLNSPEGPLFNKRRCFYGFCEARDSIRTNKTAVVVEGYTDVIMAHQFGVDSVVAVLGTALTEYHARTLSNLCDQVILVFDADEAGQKSAERSIEVLLEADIEPKIASLPSGLDPCELLLEEGEESFRECLDASEDFLSYRFQRVAQRFDLSTVNGRARACDELLQIPASVENETKRDMLVREIASELGVTEQSAFAYLERAWQQRQEYGSPESGEETPTPDRMSAGAALPGELAGSLMLHPEWQQRAADQVDLQVLDEGPDRQLLQTILQHCREEGPISGGELIHKLTDSDLISHAATRLETEKEKERAIVNFDAQHRFEQLLQCVERQKRRQEKLNLLHMKHDVDDESEDEDEGLRHYYEMRLEEDKQASRLNPRKDNQ